MKSISTNTAIAIVLVFFSISLFSQQKLNANLILLQLDNKINAHGRIGGISVDALGNLFVANFDDELYKVRPNGKVSLLSDGLYGSSGNYIDEKGNIYQASFYGNRIYYIDRDGKKTLYADKGLDGPVGIARAKDGSIVVCNCKGNSVVKINSDGDSDVIARGELFNCPNGITLGPDGHLYVVNFNNDHIIKISENNDHEIFTSIKGGEGNGHIAYHNNIFYITKIKTNQVFKVSISGDSKLIAGSGIDSNSQTIISQPNGITLNKETGDLFINTINGKWRGNEPTTIDIIKIDQVDLKEILIQHLEQSDYESANKAFWEYKNNPSNTGEDLGPQTGKLAWQYMSQRKVKEALLLFTLISEAYPERWRPWYYLGEVYKIIGQPTAALEYYKKAQERDPNNAQVKGKIKELKN